MKIRSHSESHVVEMEDGSQWQIFPGDLDVTLSWEPETELSIVQAADDEVGTHALVSGEGRVRVIRASKRWPIREVKSVLKEG
jgi:hypothetical protein